MGALAHDLWVRLRTNEGNSIHAQSVRLTHSQGQAGASQGRQDAVAGAGVGDHSLVSEIHAVCPMLALDGDGQLVGERGGCVVGASMEGEGRGGCCCCRSKDC